MEPMEPMKPMKPMRPMKAEPAWWPANLGSPNSSGSQNGSRYAYFASARRLLVDTGGQVKTYDTGAHQIQGFGQQSDDSAMRFQSNNGVVDLASLKVVG
jgi:hypothetical protein